MPKAKVIRQYKDKFTGVENRFNSIIELSEERFNFLVDKKYVVPVESIEDVPVKKKVKKNEGSTFES